MPTITAFLLSFVLLADFSSSVKSYQTLNDYYRTSYQSYITSKNKYLTYRTLTAQKEALDNGREFLKTRDQLILTYLDVLKNKVNESGGYSDTDKSLILGKLNVEAVWLSDFRSKYDGTETLNDLQNISNQIQDRYLNTIKPVSLNVAGSVYINKFDVIYNTLDQILANMDNLVQRISKEGTNIELAQRWLLEAKNKASLAKDKESQARDLFNNLHGQTIETNFNQGVFALTEGNQYMREASSYISEIIKNLKGI